MTEDTATTLLVRASWPSTVCPERGLHYWIETRSALICGWCGQRVYADRDAYRRWSTYWFGLISGGAVARNN